MINNHPLQGRPISEDPLYTRLYCRFRSFTESAAMCAVRGLTLQVHRRSGFVLYTNSPCPEDQIYMLLWIINNPQRFNILVEQAIFKHVPSSVQQNRDIFPNRI